MTGVHLVRTADADDLLAAAQLLHDFNLEFDEPAEDPPSMAVRLRRLLATRAIEILLVGPGPDGMAVLAFQDTIWSDAPNVYLNELYVVPDRRGEGMGRALMAAVLENARERGADHIDLTTSTDDEAARGLYESLGFTNREGSPDGPVMLYYEREL